MCFAVAGATYALGQLPYLARYVGDTFVARISRDDFAAPPSERAEVAAKMSSACKACRAARSRGRAAPRTRWGPRVGLDLRPG
jgi:hypothetical protein